MPAEVIEEARASAADRDVPESAETLVIADAEVVAEVVDLPVRSSDEPLEAVAEGEPTDTIVLNAPSTIVVSSTRVDPAEDPSAFAPPSRASESAGDVSSRRSEPVEPPAWRSALRPEHEPETEAFTVPMTAGPRSETGQPSAPTSPAAASGAQSTPTGLGAQPTPAGADAFHTPTSPASPGAQSTPADPAAPAAPVSPDARTSTGAAAPQPDGPRAPTVDSGGALPSPTGDDSDPEPAPELLLSSEKKKLAGADEPVLVVDGRPRYHLDDCPQLDGRTPVELTVGTAIDLGFTPCSRCAAATRLLVALRR